MPELLVRCWVFLDPRVAEFTVQDLSCQVTFSSPSSVLHHGDTVCLRRDSRGQDQSCSRSSHMTFARAVLTCISPTFLLKNRETREIHEQHSHFLSRALLNYASRIEMDVALRHCPPPTQITLLP